MVYFMHCLSVMHWYYSHAVTLWCTVYNILCIKFADIQEELGNGTAGKILMKRQEKGILLHDKTVTMPVEISKN